ncbi:MAG: phytanoyl-CoA dioxygenase family protein [Crocinitomicaceae bacterium]|nr:phytanoyl-CoA dioxygenase family protein [Crocinitomicaceae bacterium]
MIKEISKAILFPILFIADLFSFSFIQRTSNLGYQGFRYLFVKTNGYSNDFASKFISILHPNKSSSNSKGILGELDTNKIKEICSDIRENGFTTFDVHLPDSYIHELVRFAESTPVSYLEFDKKYITYSQEKVLFNSENNFTPRFQFETDQLLENETIKLLCFDASMRAIAAEYLNTEPILDLISMWWSLPYGEEAEDKAAQMYHFDMDRFGFLKFFFYLTDVDETNGPHCYVRKSNKRLPKKIREDRRITDQEVNDLYPKEDILELCGKKGSILAVDTRGLHKGKPLIAGKRLLFQLQFSNSLFGQSYSQPKPTNLSVEQKKLKSQYPRTYQLINDLSDE